MSYFEKIGIEASVNYDREKKKLIVKFVNPLFDIEAEVGIPALQIVGEISKNALEKLKQSGLGEFVEEFMKGFKEGMKKR